MNRRIVLGIAVVASFIGALSLVSKYSTAPTIDWERNFQSALARAQSGRMTVAVYLYTDWCRYCKQMDSETFSDAQVIAEVGRRYLWVRLNAEEDPDGARLRQEYGVRGFPTFILFDADGEWIDQLEGYLPPQEFGAALQSLTHGPDSFPRLKARVRESPGSVAMHYALGHRYLERRRYPQAEQEFSKIIAMDSRNDSGQTPAAIHNLAVSLAAQSRYSDALEKLDGLNSRFPDADVTPEAALLRGQIQFQAGRPAAARKTLTAVLSKYPGSPHSSRARSLLAELDEAAPSELSH